MNKGEGAVEAVAKAEAEDSEEGVPVWLSYSGMCLTLTSNPFFLH